MKYSPGKLALALIGWLVLTDGLVGLIQLTDAWPPKVLAFLCMSLLPGAALLRAFRARPSSLLEGVIYSFGLSILVFMLSGLMANQILFQLGVQRPLELPGILGAWNASALLCIGAGLWTNRSVFYVRCTALRRPTFPAKTTAILIIASVFLPVLATFGAFRLNNGGDAFVAEIALVWAAGVIVYAVLLRNRLKDGALAWSIFCCGLSILLMTALRSWDITGHDSMREFHVYTLAHTFGRWDIAAYRDPYNACLSITILPEVYSKLLHVSGLAVFKFILQVIFAVCPVVVFLTLRRYVSKFGALAGCVLFISYPTFINDSAMLTRQGVAYLFFSLGLLAAMRSHKESLNKWLFLACGLGVVLSHYSTSYMFVAIFAVALVVKLIIQRLRGWQWQLWGDRFTVVTPGVLLAIMLATFTWYGILTATSGGLAVTLERSVANLPHLLSDDNKSTDTSAALVPSTHKTQLDVYQAYLANPSHSSKIARAELYQPEIVADEIPLTKSGRQARTIGIEPTITADLRQNYAKVLQLLAATGVFYLTYFSVFYLTYLLTRKKPSMLPLDLICFSLAGIVLLIGIVILPTISLNYGILRAFQQSLIFLLVPLMLFLTVIGRRLGRLKTTVATTALVALFWLFSGLFAQLWGGVGAALTLNNRGLYYGLYYTTAADLQGFAWMKAHLAKDSGVHAASFSKAIMHDPEYPFKEVGILPTQAPPGSYVYLDQAQVVAGKLYVYSGGSPLITSFPIEYYKDWTNQIYSTSTTGVYH